MADVAPICDLLIILVLIVGVHTVKFGKKRHSMDGQHMKIGNVSPGVYWRLKWGRLTDPSLFRFPENLTVLHIYDTKSNIQKVNGDNYASKYESQC